MSDHHGRAASLQGELALDAEGHFLGVRFLWIVNAGRVDAAAAFIDAALSPAWQARMTAAYNMGPINKTVAPAPDFAKAMPKEGDGVVFDESVINARLAEWTERFNAAVAK